MRADLQSAPAGDAHVSRAALVAELRRLEEALQRAQGQLMTMGGEVLPGIHLVVEAAGQRGILPAGRVLEVVRLVATTPLAGAPQLVRGTFVCRGAPIVAVDLASLLQRPREPAMDAQIVILAGTPTVGLVVDRVARLVEGPRLFEGDVAAGTPEAWRGSAMVAGLCVDAGEVLPVIDPTPVLEALAGRSA